MEEPLPLYPLVVVAEEEVVEEEEVAEEEAEASHLPLHQELLEENSAGTHLPNSRGTTPWRMNS